MATIIKGFRSAFFLKILLISLAFSALSNVSARASSYSDGEEFNPGDLIINHVLDNHIWHLFDGHYGTLYLPVIVYSQERGFEFFSSRRFYDEDV